MLYAASLAGLSPAVRRGTRAMTLRGNVNDLVGAASESGHGARQFAKSARESVVLLQREGQARTTAGSQRLRYQRR